MLSPVIGRMPVLILNPHSRCNCRCVMCDIWKETTAREMSAEQLERHSSDIAALGVEWIVLSGGEALMHSDLFRLCEILRRRQVRITVLSTGLLLKRHAARIAEFIDDVIVSLDGPPDVHDRIRRVPGAFGALAEGVRELRLHRRDFPVAARCTVQKENCATLTGAIQAAREIGLDSISFLAADVTSSAFNRPTGWTIGKQAEVAPSPDEIRTLEAEMESIIASGQSGHYVLETPAKLRGIVAHFEGNTTAPVCNAPWVSAVVEADGVVRPCFFQPTIGTIGEGSSLREVINGSKAVAFRSQLNVATDPICGNCVCSLNWKN
jgi:Fe-coproporphyrin III synthase